MKGHMCKVPEISYPNSRKRAVRWRFFSVVVGQVWACPRCDTRYRVVQPEGGRVEWVVDEVRS